ncbi:MAG TPA: hypothetical protein VEA99_02885 [Gemmatimonadaceae bacterium]|nr:hypothetical protein [Gemmatimonadaceae bacterium]
MTTHDIGPDRDFERWLAQAAPTLNEPPATPKDDMWAEVAARLPQPTARGRRPSARGRWTWPVMVAAALLLGAAIDRFLLRRAAEVAGPPRIADGAATPRTDAPVDPRKPRPRPSDPERAVPRPDAVARRPEASASLRLAASQTLAQAELLLAAYQADDADDAAQLARWSRDVLSSTRLLLDSRAAADPTLRALLEDLELVLMQIAQLSGTPSGVERELLDRALRDRDLLPRLRTAAPTGPPTTTTGTSD